MAADCELCRDFSIILLCILVQADVRGRIAPDTEELLERMALCRQEAEALGCLYGAGTFADPFTQRAYFQERRVWRAQSLYNDTWGEVILLSGLPGTGKDAWLAKITSRLPMISLDQLRKTMGLAPTDAQERVIQAAMEQARQYLRAQMPFIWNARNLTESMRGKLIRLFESYGAAVRIVYLETGWGENLRRNASRHDAMPEPLMEDMLGRLVPPQRWEAQYVDWRCI